MGNLVQRTCMGCREKKEKNELIRIVKQNQDVKIDLTGKLDGRGAYICSNIKCLEKVIKTKRLEKVLNIKISEEIYNNLKGVILNR